MTGVKLREREDSSEGESKQTLSQTVPPTRLIRMAL